jgi:hypothetical protein
MQGVADKGDALAGVAARILERAKALIAEANTCQGGEDGRARDDQVEARRPGAGPASTTDVLHGELPLSPMLCSQAGADRP